jgi:hypothetical protein
MALPLINVLEAPVIAALGGAPHGSPVDISPTLTIATIIYSSFVLQYTFLTLLAAHA